MRIHVEDILPELWRSAEMADDGRSHAIPDKMRDQLQRGVARDDRPTANHKNNRVSSEIN